MLCLQRWTSLVVVLQLVAATAAHVRTNAQKIEGNMCVRFLWHSSAANCLTPNKAVCNLPMCIDKCVDFTDGWQSSTSKIVSAVPVADDVYRSAGGHIHYYAERNCSGDMIGKDWFSNIYKCNGSIVTTCPGAQSGAKWTYFHKL